jgi:hypothetical protein
MSTWGIDVGSLLIKASEIENESGSLRDFIITKNIDEVKQKIEDDSTVITGVRGKLARFRIPDLKRIFPEFIEREAHFYIDFCESESITSFIKLSSGEILFKVQNKSNVFNRIKFLNGIEPSYIDIDILAIERAFEFSYPGKHKVLLVDIGEKYIKLNFENRIGIYIANTGDIAREIKQRLKYFNISCIMLSGGESIGMIEELEERLGIRVELLNPLRRLQVLKRGTKDVFPLLTQSIGLALLMQERARSSFYR